jgi:hypothetical protein
MSVNRIDATLTDDQRDRANAALAALADALPFPSSGRAAERPSSGPSRVPGGELSSGDSLLVSPPTQRTN